MSLHTGGSAAGGSLRAATPPAEAMSRSAHLGAAMAVHHAAVLSIQPKGMRAVCPNCAAGAAAVAVVVVKY